MFRYGEGIIYLDSEVPDGAFDFGMPEQKLDSPEITRAPIDQGGFCPLERMGSKEFRVQSNACDPLGNEPCILAGRHALAHAAPAGEQEFARFLVHGLQVVID